MKPIQPKGQPNLSIICKSNNTSVSELYHVKQLLQDGTEEVKFLLSYECNVKYQCCSCQNFFKSIVNFLSHKRTHCTKKIDVINHKCISNNYNHSESASELIIHKTEQTSNDVKNDRIHRSQVSKQSNKTDFSGIDLLNKNQEEMVKQLKIENTTFNVPDDRHIYLETIDTNHSVVHQTIESSNAVDVIDLIKKEVTELQNITDQNVIVVKEQMPENQLEKSHSPIQVNMSDEENELKSINDLSCPLCNAKFSTNETLLVHVKTLHTSKRLCYSCPCCSHVFTNSWSVYRHLYKGHKKTLKQIHKLKSQIEKKTFYREIAIERNSVDNNNDPNIILPEESDNSILLSPTKNQFVSNKNLKSPAIIRTDTNKVSYAASKMKNKKKKASSFYSEKQLINSKERDKIEVEEDNSKLQSSRSTRSNQKKNSKNQKWKNWALLKNKIAAVADYRKLRCLLCQHKFSSIPNLRRHIMTHINWYRYSRKLYNLKCFVKRNCVAHCSKVHNMQKNSTVLAEMILETSKDEYMYKEDTSANITDPKTRSDYPDFMDVDMVDVTTSLCQLETHVNSNDSIDLDGCVTLQNEIIAANIRARELCESTKCQNVYAGDSDKTVKMQDPSTECTMNCKKLNDILKWMVMEVILGPTNTSLIRVRTDFDKSVL